MAIKDQMKVLNDLRKAQKELKNEIVEVEAGDGAVVVQVTGELKVKKVTLDPEKIDFDDIHELERRLKESLTSRGLPSCGKLSFASGERMMRYLGLEPGSVSPFGLINDTQNHVHLFLDENLLKAETLSFHPNDCRGTVVITREAFGRYLETVGNSYEYISLY